MSGCRMSAGDALLPCIEGVNLRLTVEQIFSWLAGRSQRKAPMVVLQLSGLCCRRCTIKS